MSLNIEKQSLSAHVEICSERYQGLKEDLTAMSEKILKMETDMATRMDKLESIITDIKNNLIQKEQNALRSLIMIGIAIIASLLGTVGGLVWYVITHPIQ